MKTKISKILVIAGNAQKNCASFAEANAVIADFRAKGLSNKIDVLMTWADGHEGSTVLDMFDTKSIEDTLCQTQINCREQIDRGFAEAMPGMESCYRNMEKDLHALFEGYEVGDVAAKAAQKLKVTTLAGKVYEFEPVPMNTIPSHHPSAWLKFLGRHAIGTELSESTQNSIQRFMRKHNTEALFDGISYYTLAGGMLAWCDPMAV